MKNTTAFKFILLLIFLSFSAQNTVAQKAKTNSLEWIKMMDDPNVNYFKAVENFNNYWKNREKPTEENEIFREKSTEKRKKESKETLKYAFEYKKFLNWQKKTLPFVKSDGTILSQKERIEIWEQEKLKRKKQ